MAPTLSWFVNAENAQQHISAISSDLKRSSCAIKRRPWNVYQEHDRKLSLFLKDFYVWRTCTQWHSNLCFEYHLHSYNLSPRWKDIPLPLNAEWYSPEKIWLDKPRVLTSIFLTFSVILWYPYASYSARYLYLSFKMSCISNMELVWFFSINGIEIGATASPSVVRVNIFKIRFWKLLFGFSLHTLKIFVNVCTEPFFNSISLFKVRRQIKVYDYWCHT